jgi:YidC/Oxa1 family membrane protein insertase
MFSTIWNTLLVNPIFNILVFIEYLVGDWGVSIIIFTILMRFALVPIVLPSMRTMKKQKELQPEIIKLKNKYKHDKKKQAEAQMALFKEHGLNPASGCITQIPMLLVLFAVFGVISKITGHDIASINSHVYFDFLKLTGDSLNLKFLFWNLGKSDPYYVLPIISGLSQFIVSKVSFGFNQKAQGVAKKTPDKSDDLAYNVQQQMLYMMPIMTAYISTQLPTGVVIYIIVTSIFSFFQTYLLLGGSHRDELLKKIK